MDPHSPRTLPTSRFQSPNSSSVNVGRPHHSREISQSGIDSINIRSPPAYDSAKGKRPAEKHVEKPPSVYWSDRASTIDPNPTSQYTFYREGTPTPPEYEFDDEEGRGDAKDGRTSTRGYGEGAGRSSAGTGSAMLRRGYDDVPSFAPPPRQSNGRRICGMRMWVFWAVVAAAVFVIIGVAVGVGVGVGLGRNLSSSSSSSSSTSSTSSAPSSTASSSTGGTSTVSSGSSSPTTGSSVDLACPEANNTVYNVPGSAKQFMRSCGIDYSGVGGAFDIHNVTASSMAECMDDCAAYPACTGCSWGYIFGDSGTNYTCWLKNNLQTPHNASADWLFAVLVT